MELRGTHLADAGAGERRAALLRALGGRGRPVVYLALLLDVWRGKSCLFREFLALGADHDGRRGVVDIRFGKVDRLVAVRCCDCQVERSAYLVLRHCRVHQPHYPWGQATPIRGP